MKFSEMLTEYLDERDRQDSDYYDNRYIGAGRASCERMEELLVKMDKIFSIIEFHMTRIEGKVDE